MSSPETRTPSTVWTLLLFALGAVLVLAAASSYRLFPADDVFAWTLVLGAPLFYAATALFTLALRYARSLLRHEQACATCGFLLRRLRRDSASGVGVASRGADSARTDPIGFAAGVGAPLFMFLLPTLVVCWIWAYRPGQATYPRMLALALVALAPAMVAYSAYAGRIWAALAELSEADAPHGHGGVLDARVGEGHRLVLFARAPRVEQRQVVVVGGHRHLGEQAERW